MHLMEAAKREERGSRERPLGNAGKKVRGGREKKWYGKGMEGKVKAHLMVYLRS